MSAAQLSHLIATTAIGLDRTRAQLRLYPKKEEREYLLGVEIGLIDTLKHLHAAQQEAESREIRERASSTTEESYLTKKGEGTLTNADIEAEAARRYLRSVEFDASVTSKNAP